MNRGKVLFTLLAGVVVAGGGAAWQPAAAAEAAQTPPAQAQPRQEIPERTENGISGSSLSEKLDRSGGVIRPPAGVDPGIAQPPPPVPPQSTPIVPPPGTPGGKPDVHPK